MRGKLVRSGALDVVVIDSVAALVPQAEIDGEMGDPQMGLQARLMSQAMRKLTGMIHKTKTCVIFVNQIRHKIGVFFGSPETTTGGNALKFYASLRLDIRRIDAIKAGQEIIGNRTRVKIVKNKVAPPFKQVEFDIMYGKGISYAGELLDLAVQQDIIQKSGAWFSHGDERIGQGRDNAKTYLDEHPEVAASIEAQVRTTLGLPQVASEILAASAEAASLDTNLFQNDVLLYSKTSSKRAAPGSHTATNVSGKVATMPRPIWTNIPRWLPASKPRCVQPSAYRRWQAKY